MNQNEIYQKLNLLIPSNQQLYLVIGDDLDAFLSAALFIKYHPNTKIIGFYEAYQILYIHKSYSDFLPNCIWLDLDIYNKNCISLGHHILKIDTKNNLFGFNNSLNINDLRSIGVNQFQKKYPLATVHFLLDLYNEEYLPETEMELLIWLADSSYINAQKHKFKQNVSDWITFLFQSESIKNTFLQIDDIAFENRMHLFYDKLKSLGFQQGTGQTKSLHLQLSGFQLQTSIKNEMYFKKITKFISEITSWPNIADFILLSNKNIYNGIRNNTELSAILMNNKFDDFLNEKKIFSYVITHKNRINYTSSIDL